MNRPNIILLTIDTLRVDRLGCYGHNAQLTPNIDRLAQSGIRFDQAISGGSWTQAAFPVLLTSSYAAMYGGCLGRLAPERPRPLKPWPRMAIVPAAFPPTSISAAPPASTEVSFILLNWIPGEVDPPLRRIKAASAFCKMN